MICPKCEQMNQCCFVIFEEGVDNYCKYVLYYVCNCGQEYLKRFEEYLDYGFKTLNTT